MKAARLPHMQVKRAAAEFPALIGRSCDLKEKAS